MDRRESVRKILLTSYGEGNVGGWWIGIRADKCDDKNKEQE